MAKQKLEIECPVCDAKISIDARSCPKCGADLGMADFQDLENLAKDISEGRSYSGEVPEKESVEEKEVETETKEEAVAIPPNVEPNPEKKESKKESKPKAVPSPPVEPKKEEPKKVEPKKEKLRKPEAVSEEDKEAPGEKGKKKGLFSKFFGKKK